MDFKSLIQKIDSLDTPIETVKAPTLAAPIRLDEDTELRVLAGVTALTESVIMEKSVSKAQQKAAGAALAAKRGDAPKSELKGASKEMMSMSTKELEKFAGTKHKGLPEKKTDESVEEAFDSDAKVGDKKKTQHGTLTKTATGVKHERSYKGDDSDKDDAPKAKKAKKESVELDDDFSDKFQAMVEAKKKEKDDKKKKMEEAKKSKMTKKDEKMDEAAKPDFLDVDKDGNKKEPMKKAAKEADKGEDKKETKGLSAKQKKLPPGLQKAIAKKKGTAEGVETNKKVVAESVEPKMSFRDMMKLVVESGGQQQIDPLDKELFAWATRVAENKLGEGLKAEVYAGLVYERMGGVFEMYDVLSEDQK
jgi:hypothetical protein